MGLALAGTFAMGGCSPTPALEAYFPLAAGHQWTYRIQTRFENDPEPKLTERRMENRGLDDIAGGRAWRRRTEQGVEYWLRSDETGVYRVAHRVPPDLTLKEDSPRRYVLRAPIAVGTQWDAPTTLYLLATRYAARNELERPPTTVLMTYRITAVNQSLATPAGHFDRCVRVEGQAEVRIWVDTLRQWRNMPVHASEWYCETVGLVRQERIESSPSRFMTGGSVLLELLAWD